MSNVIKLSDVLDNGMYHSVKDMLWEAAGRAEENPEIKIAVVLFLKEDGTIGWNQAGLNTKRDHMNFFSKSHNDYILDCIEGF